MLKINNMLDKMNIIGNEGDDLRDYLYSMSEPTEEELEELENARCNKADDDIKEDKLERMEK